MLTGFYHSFALQWKRCLTTVLLCLAVFTLAKAGEEPYLNELKGAQLTIPDNHFTVTDEKFKNLTLWSKIQQNISVDNVLSFEINFDTSYYFYNKPFTASITVTIQRYENASDTSEVAGTETITLDLRYDTITGSPYKGIALYKFKGAHKFKVTINDIDGPLGADGKVLPIFRLKGQTIINRKYNFVDASTDVSIFSKTDEKLTINWNGGLYEGAEMYDLEYTTIDSASEIGLRIKNNYSEGTTAIPADTLAKWFVNNSTRITTAASFYSLNLNFNSGYLLYRIRGVQISYPDEIRYEGDWNYNAKYLSDGDEVTAVVKINWHQQNLNWQYSATFAEEGKRKEVISYFDGTLRNRQSVTINNSDDVAVVQESVLDPLGRPTINILPAPINDNRLIYYPGVNKNKDGIPYSFADITEDADCRTGADTLHPGSGAAQYYSSNNPFTSLYFSKYVPKAEGYPFTVTEYTGDNTGRIRSQGGVGASFQLGSGHETRYFYEKPTQPELDRLFGVEAGHFEHYLKNTVLDANGQLSVSYVDASGKTIATALAGVTPPNLTALPSNGEEAVMQQTANLFGPTSFERNAADYEMFATASFVAKTTGDYQFNYKIDPYKLQSLYANDDSVICSNCYYDVLIKVTDDCGNVLDSTTRNAVFSFDTSCIDIDTIKGTINLELSKIGEYYVSYSLKVSKQALNYYDSGHFVKNTDIKQFNSFLRDELVNTNFFSCFNDCQTCLEDLGTKEEFIDRFKGLYLNDSLTFQLPDSSVISNLYDSLLVNCINQQGTCDLVAPSPCDTNKEMLKLDVTPGGQYALYDSTSFSLLELPINVLNKRDSVAFFVDEFGKRDSVIIVDEEGNELIKDVKELTTQQFIEYWKQSWADSLVRFHPEYCYYQWCIANDSSARFNQLLEEYDEADTAIAKGYFIPGDPYALLNKDPFFKPGANGYSLYNRMQDSLRLFSRTLVRESQSDKNILQFIDIALYCKSQPDGWDNCVVDDSCRSRNLEWELYKRLYLNLKVRFNEEARRKTPGFENCANCSVGSDLLELVPNTVCPEKSLPEFSYYQFSNFEFCSGSGTAGSVSLLDFSPFQNNYYATIVKFATVGDSVITDTVTVSISEATSFWSWPNEVMFCLDRFFGPSDVYVDNIDSSKMIAISCAANYTPFLPPTTCNVICPGGVYTPYDKDSISYYIEYGNPNTAPSGTPENYSGCQFYATFTVKTSATEGCTFYNVWVCKLDSVCVFGDPPPGYCNPDSVTVPPCPENPNAALMEGKQRRYLEYADPTGFINNALKGNPNQNSDANSVLMTNECRTGCEGQADYWINILRGCNGDSAQLAELKQALIDICSAGCAYASPFGTSSVPDTVSGLMYYTFEDAIIGILGSDAITDSCAVELLGGVYPYNKQPKQFNRTVFETDYEICNALNQWKTKYAASGFTGTLHQYLQKELTVDYVLDEEQLTDLNRSCVSCNGILRNTLVLPIAFEANAAPGISCDSMAALLLQFQSKFPEVDSLHPNYEILLSNFFNNQLGYSLTYAEYQDFLDSCTALEGSYRLLYNHAANVIDNDTTSGPDNTCITEKFRTAISNALLAYNFYADSVHRAFRTAYLEQCLGITPVLTMTSDLYEYHYTLYYYDQSGNLVKTVPPQGVVLLTETEQQQVDTYRKANINNLESPNAILPDHELVTTYAYNSLNQVVTQHSPDGGTSRFYYDRLGRLVVSQNAKQETEDKYSYTRYDFLGRMTEVGELEHGTAMTDAISKDTTGLENWYLSKVNRSQITFTVYDAPNVSLVANSGITNTQGLGTSRKRVVASFYKKGTLNANVPLASYDHATHYKYDINGNVETLWQENRLLADYDNGNQGIRRIDYNYDLVSGKVNRVIYQKDKGDQFLHKYEYDAENRLIAAFTSRDALLWQQQATYRYYLHGPLARTELGQYKVQGIDYAYTLQGWKKGINSHFADSSKDMGGDAWQTGGNPRSVVSKDVFAFSIGYHNNDYKPIGGSSAPAFGLNYTAPGSLGSGVQLYNGNISYTTLSLSKINDGNLTGYSYQYDQLNQIIKMNQHTGIAFNASSWSNSSIVQDYKEEIAYDANGNILRYLRNGTSINPLPGGVGGGLNMDSLTYHYTAGTNKLDHVRDAIADGNYSVDIDNQASGNYEYDPIGNLVKDTKEGISNISWTVYGKINSITKTNGTTISYAYDATGNRVQKTVVATGAGTKNTFYVRDVQGNVVSVYADSSSTGLTLNEQHLFGISRLGLYNWGKAIATNAPVPQWQGGSSYTPVYDSILPGSLSFELNNHLGNVLSTISDKKIGIPLNDTVVNSYIPEVLSQNDYYPFGMMMPGRGYMAGSGYRYGFNGKEQDPETYGEGNIYDYGFRIYNPRLGKFLSVDPLTKDYPWFTPYQFAGNRPIVAIDLDGLEPHDVNTQEVKKDLRPTAGDHASRTDPIVFGTDAKPWMDLIKFKIPQKLLDARPAAANEQKIENARGSLTNLDFYSVIITKLPDGVNNAGELFEKIRLNLGNFLDKKTDFAGYSSNGSDLERWKSDNPLGSIMSFDAWFNDPVTPILWNLDDASVMTSSYFKNSDGGYWTFSTLVSNGDGYHPIAGTRQFGVSTFNQNGTTSYLFYIRASDRVFDFATNTFGGQNTVFKSADVTWNAVCKNIFMYINNSGGSALVPSNPISKRVPWKDVQTQIK